MRQTSINLIINGREKTFDEKELVDILKKHYDEDVIRIKMPKEAIGVEIHEVIPEDINRKLFEEKRIDEVEESARNFILYALENLDRKPSKYGKPFKTIIYMSKFENMTLGDVCDFTKKYGDYLANTIDQGLEWAYRITMGETWESVCKDVNRGWYKMVQHENRYFFMYQGAEKKSTIDTVAWSDDDYRRHVIKEEFKPVIKA